MTIIFFKECRENVDILKTYDSSMQGMQVQEIARMKQSKRKEKRNITCSPREKEDEVDTCLWKQKEAFLETNQ